MCIIFSLPCYIKNTFNSPTFCQNLSFVTPSVTRDADLRPAYLPTSAARSPLTVKVMYWCKRRACPRCHLHISRCRGFIFGSYSKLQRIWEVAPVKVQITRTVMSVNVLSCVFLMWFRMDGTNSYILTCGLFFNVQILFSGRMLAFHHHTPVWSRSGG